MNSLSSTQSVIRISLAAGLALGLATLSGCGVGLMSGNTTSDTVSGRIAGTIHGGPNPVSGATVTLYATGASGGASTGYGVGTVLQTATSDAGGNFTFAGGYTCPAGQFAYVVASGGKTGANNVNPNSVLLDAIGTCANLSASTFTVINELTTIAAGYTLSNFMNITGDAVHGYVVSIGAPATNNAPSGCVSNSFYGTGTCPTTSAAGLAHAFANASMLVNSFSGQVNTTSSTGAIIPYQFINTLGNVLQACVNSNGGGTDLTAGTPTTTTSTAGGTTNDGTPCGKLFAFTSYTADGTSSGTLNAPGNTLAAIQNLAKRPSGSATLFNSTCDSGSTGTTSAASCIFNVATPVGIYQTSMTSAPPDWMLGVSYPKGSFSTGNNAIVCGGSVTPATNGSLYPYMLATDINDNLVILNEDGSAGNCYNLLTIANDGTPLGGNSFDNTTAFPSWVSTDAFGHAIVPANKANAVRIYTAGPTDTNITLVQSIVSGTAGTNSLPAASLPNYTAVDSSGNIFVTAQNTVNNLGFLAPGTQSHATPSYTGSTIGTVVTSKLNMVSVDINNNAFSTNSNSSGSGKTYLIAAGGASYLNVGVLTGSSSNGQTTEADTTGHVYNVQTPNSSLYTATAGQVSANLVIDKQSYTPPSTLGAATQTTITPGQYKPQAGTIDGNNVIWFADLQGSIPTGTTTINFSNLRGYDTVNNYGTNPLYGCKFATTSSTACGSQSTDSNFPSSTPYLFYGSRGVAVDSAGSLWVANGTQGQINEIFGLAAPTWPLFIHNGTSNKP